MPRNLRAAWEPILPTLQQLLATEDDYATRMTILTDVRTILQIAVLSVGWRGSLVKVAVNATA